MDIIIATDRALFSSEKCFDEALLTSTHNVCFRGEIRKILCGYPLLSVAMHNYVKHPAGNHVTGYEKWIIKKNTSMNSIHMQKQKQKKLSVCPLTNKYHIMI